MPMLSRPSPHASAASLCAAHLNELREETIMPAGARPMWTTLLSSGAATAGNATETAAATATGRWPAQTLQGGIYTIK